ncbi:TIGR00296 family protein [Candidatus Woesearchaeota archaeon]|nr:TIGR00296 family protein [Candidatus Woesearchaeota archaeon]
MKLTKKEGEELLKLARASIYDKEIKIKDKGEKCGVFVTIYSAEDHSLRGCIGYPEPIMPLKEAVVAAAKAAAFEDPRFGPLEKEEKIKMEISILTVPELIKVASPKEYPKNIEIGKDGLILRHDGYQGLLLPQVAVEDHMDAELFLENVCLKAGLSQDAWLDAGVKIYKFQAQIFRE